MWKKIRIDFTDTVKCQFCSRMITSGKAIVVQNELGNISFQDRLVLKIRTVRM